METPRFIKFHLAIQNTDRISERDIFLLIAVSHMVVFFGGLVLLNHDHSLSEDGAFGHLIVDNRIIHLVLLN